jgi:hypothetical protein
MPPMRAAELICWPGPEVTPIWPTSWCGMPPGAEPGWLGLCAMPGAMGCPGGPPGCCCIPPGCGENPGPILAIISRAADYPPGGYRLDTLRVIACEAGQGPGVVVQERLVVGVGRRACGPLRWSRGRQGASGGRKRRLRERVRLWRRLSAGVAGSAEGRASREWCDAPDGTVRIGMPAASSAQS